ncbi:hypothetical protein [Streptomyces sp. NBC_01462]|uniref:hypothetical protein n=1 Tax=Streptomyces sp. NBC_01462 TaxID=2903876 RepID=UPI002E2ED74E|nr:hypothetical protein [Streptomyces sp. NBC_01462]
MTWSKVTESLCAGARRDEDEHRRTHQGSGGGHVHSEQGGENPALTELRTRLAEGQARARLNQTQLSKQAALGRTTVSEAFSHTKPVPSAETVVALARVLRLPAEELLELRRTAVEESGTVTPGGPGRPIGLWDPHDLELHPAGTGRISSDLDTPGLRALPGYVPREHDRVLGEVVRDAVTGRSQISVLVGTSSTGKTRACWEAVQPLAAKGWRLWHPFDPTRAEAALEDLQRVEPRTVVWLNEAQHYLGHPTSGEQIAAAVHHLLITPERGPVLVLGTLWPEYAKQYTALPRPEAEDPHSRVRELLAGHVLAVPDTFDAQALAAAIALAENGDRLMADALTRARTDGRVTQDLAGAPELLNRYQNAGPAAHALLNAAMDARRLGVGPHLSQAFLTDAATDYLDQHDYDQLTGDWVERAYAELAELVHGKQAPLRRTTPRARRRPPAPTATSAPTPPTSGPQFRLADYLEQHGLTIRRTLCPPASFWHAAHTHLVLPDALDNLAEAAETRHRLQWASHLHHRAAAYGSTYALVRLAEIRDEAGDREGAEALLREAADRGDTTALDRLATIRGRAGDQEGAEALLREAADLGDTTALHRLAKVREEAGHREGAEALLRELADLGDTTALHRLTELREEAGDRLGVEALAREAADLGDTSALHRLATIRERAGDQEEAEALLREAADLGDTHALHRLATVREWAGERDSAEALLREAADLGDTHALRRLAWRRERAGDPEGAEALLQEAADLGDTRALDRMIVMREEAGDREGAEALLQEIADRGPTDALFSLAKEREEVGDRKGAEVLLRELADRGQTDALFSLALTRGLFGDREGSEAVLQEAAVRGDMDAMDLLAKIWKEAGDREGAEALLREIADRAGTEVYDLSPGLRERLKAQWPYGLDPDGTPTRPWHPPSTATLLN